MLCAQNYFQLLPPEIKLTILNYVNDIDIIVLNELYDEFKDALNKTSINLSSTSCDNIYNLNKLRLKKGLFSTFITDVIVELNLSGVYWINKTDLESVIGQLKNLQYLNLVGTVIDVNKHTSDFIKELNRKTRTTFFTTHNLIGNVRLQSSFLDRSFTLNLYNLYERVGKVYLVQVGQDHLMSVNTIEQIISQLIPKPFTICVQDQEKSCSCQSDLAVTDTEGTLEGSDIFTNRKQLFIHVTSKLKSSVLIHWLEKFKNVKWLHIVNNYKLDVIPHLNILRQIENFRYECKLYFHIEKILEKLLTFKNNQLKRLALKCDDASKFSYKMLRQFLDENRQLEVFLLEVNLPLKVINAVKKILKEYVRTPTQIFRIWKEHDIDKMLTSIPFSHYDMLGYHVKISY